MGRRSTYAGLCVGCCDVSSARHRTRRWASTARRALSGGCLRACVSRCRTRSSRAQRVTLSTFLRPRL
eukprot:11209136-Lingulodinium_polyedra.AAC.1